MASATFGRTRGFTSRTLSKLDLASLLKTGMTQRDSHQFKEARETFLAMRSLNPGEPHAEIGLGSVCFSEGRFEAAIEHYRQALRLSPCNAYAYALLAESQIFSGERPAARLSACHAREIDPKGPYGRLAEQLLTFMKALPPEESRSSLQHENQS
jgi:Flp pilus assembly protein TadD